MTELSALPLQIRVSTRARRLSLRISDADEKVVLVVPRGVSRDQALRFVERHRGWIERRLAARPARVPFVDGAVVPICGVPHRIRHLGLGWRGGTIIGDGEIRVGGDAPHIGRRVTDAIAHLAHRELTRLSRELAARIGKRVRRVSIRDPKTRWGSCSASGDIAYSWRLVLAPPGVMHYVVAHEVAHLQHMNHGPRFWRLVEELAPGHGSHRAWLKRNSALLHSYG